MEAVAYTLKVTWISDKINECEAVSLCGVVVRVLASNQEVLHLIPTGDSSFFIHLLWYHSKEQFALFALFSKIIFYFNKNN